MANTIRYIDDAAGDHVFPVTHERGVFDDDGNSIEPKMQHAQDIDDALVTNTAYDNASLLALDKNSYQIASTGAWGTVNTNKHLRIEVYPGDMVYITANSSTQTQYSFLRGTSAAEPGGTVYYATGYSGRELIDAGKSIRVLAPQDASYLYVYAGTYTNGYNYTPYSVKVRHVNAVKEATPMMKVEVPGKHNTVSETNPYTDFIAGHTYRAHIAAWDASEVTSSSSYYLFYVASYDASEQKTYPVIVNMGATLAPYYDFTVPADSVKIAFGGRVNKGTSGIIEVEDITSLMVAGAEKGDFLSINSAGLPERSGFSIKNLAGSITYNNLELDSSAFEHAPSGNILCYNASGLYGKSLANQTTTGSSYHNIRIPLTDVVLVEFYQYGSSNKYGSVIVDSEDKILVGMETNGVLGSTSSGVISIGVPQNAAYFIYSMASANATSYANSYVKLTYRTANSAADTRFKGIENELNGEGYIYDSYRDLLIAMPDAYIYRYGEMQNLNTVAIGDNMSSVTFRDAQNTPRYPTVIIPTEGFKIVEAYFKQQESSKNYGSLWLDENLQIVGKIRYSSSDVRDIEVPSNASYLAFNVPTYGTSNIILKKTDTIYAKIGALESEISAGTAANTLKTGMVPAFSQGAVNLSGLIDGDEQYVTTEVIYGPFKIELNEGYAIHAFHIFDRKGKMVSYNWGYPERTTLQPSNFGNTTKFGHGKFEYLAQFGLRCTYKRTDGGNILPTDNIVKKFVKFDEEGLHRWIPDDMPKYEIAWRRIMQFVHIVWVPLAKVPAWKTNNNFHLAGETQVGLPYSDVAETQKYVPQSVSIRTFLSAVSNKRSLLYTEDLENNVSRYGNSYINGNRASYFGAVCSSFVNWVFCDPGMSTSDHIGHYDLVSNPTAETLRPLDIYLKTGHVAMISSIYKDDWGKVRYIEMTEMTEPTCGKTIYTPEEFFARKANDSATIRRFNAWNQIVEPEDVSDLVQVYPGDTQRYPKFNPDIMTFAGDYACFKTGDKIILNARRNRRYTGVALYKIEESEYVLQQTIAISGYDPDDLYDDDEDWVVVNLTDLDLEAGKYKACLTDGTNTTDFTYFEIVGLTMTLTGTSGDYTLSWTTTGTPLCVDQVKANGFNSNLRDLTAEEVTAGSANITWTGSSASTYNRFRLYVQGDYGQVVGYVTLPAAS